MSIKYSIVVPVYNSEKFIRDCINSALKQGVPDFEVIVIDDGSSDSSWEIITQFRRNYERVVAIRKKNEGVALARNKALDYVRGEYVLFLDSDDLMADDLLEVVDKYIREDSIDILEFSYNYIDQNGNIFGGKTLEENYVRSNDHCLTLFLRGENSKSFCWNKVFRVEVIRELRFRYFSYSEDYLFNIEAFMKATSVRTISNPLYYYRSHPESAVNIPFNERKIDIVEAGEFAYNFLHEPKQRLYVSIYILDHCISLYYMVKSLGTCERKKYQHYFFHRFLLVYTRMYNDNAYTDLKSFHKIKYLIFRISPRIYSVLQKGLH